MFTIPTASNQIFVYQQDLQLLTSIHSSIVPTINVSVAPSQVLLVIHLAHRHDQYVLCFCWMKHGLWESHTKHGQIDAKLLISLKNAIFLG